MFNEYLVQLADKLDASGHTDVANIVDDVIRHESLNKVAQYVGAIGYVLKQNRAMQNCIRKKRVSSKGPMQEVILGCLREYQDSQDYNDTEWTSKYAEVVKAKPDLFDAAHIELLAQIAEANDMEHHVARVRQLCDSLEKNAIEDGTIEPVLDNLDILGEIIAKEVGAESRLPFKEAAPASPRSWWQRLFRPTDSWWRDTTRGRNDDARLEMDQVLENLMEITSVAQTIRLQVSQLKHQILSTSSPVTDEMKQLVNDLNPDNWRNSLQVLMRLENNMGQLPFDAANYIRNIHQQMDGVYQRLQSIQGLMKNLRQRDAILGWQGDQLASPTEEFEALDAVITRLYSDPLNEEYLYYARRMHSRLDERLKGKKVNTGVREWYIMLRNRGWTHQQIIDQIAQQMGVTSDEVNQLLSDNFRLFPDIANPTNQSHSPGADEGTMDEVANPTPTEPAPTPSLEQEQGKATLTPEQINNDILPFMLSEELVQGGTPQEKAQTLLRMISLMPPSPDWDQIKQALSEIKDGLRQAPISGAPEMPPSDAQDEPQANDPWEALWNTDDPATETSPTEESNPPAGESQEAPVAPETPEQDETDSAIQALVERAKTTPLARKAKIQTPEDLQKWLSDADPAYVDRFISDADHFTQSLGDAEQAVRKLMGADEYARKRGGYNVDYSSINNVIIDAIKETAPALSVLDKRGIRDAIRQMNPKQRTKLVGVANQIGAKRGIPDIEESLDKLMPSEDSIESFEQGVNENDYGEFGRDIGPSQMPKQQSTLSVLLKLADHCDSVNRNVADLLDKYIEEHLDDSFPDFPEFSTVVREN
jgi:hypothetical protein